MRGGTLDRKIAIQRMTSTQSPSGEVIEAWQTLSTRPASMQSLTGDERFSNDKYVARAQVAFTVRWAQALADLSPLDRIIYPAEATANSPADPLTNKIYDIVVVQEVGRREALRILTVVQQDAIPRAWLMCAQVW